MLVAVVIAFFVCWAPYQAQRLLFVWVTQYGDWTATLRDINQALFYIAGVFYFLNSTINPILYSVMSKRFRRAFRDKLCRAGSCCLCFCCSEVVIIGPGTPGLGPLGGSQSAGAQARLRAVDSHSTTTRNRLMATYTRNNVNVDGPRTAPPGAIPYPPDEAGLGEDDELSSSGRLRTCTYPQGRGNRAGNATKKSHSLPDSSLLPLCCLHSDDEGADRGRDFRSRGHYGYGSPHRHVYHRKRPMESSSMSAEWLLKKRFASKSDGDYPTNTSYVTGYDGIKPIRKGGAGLVLENHTSSCADDELTINRVEEDYEYPSSGSEYHRRTYPQDSVVQQTPGGKIHVTVTNPSDSSEAIRCSEPYSIHETKRASPIPPINSIPSTRHSFNSNSTSNPKMDKNGDSIQPAVITTSITYPQDISTGSFGGAANGTARFSDPNHLLGAAGHDHDELKCFNKDQNHKERDNDNNGDINHIPDARRLTVDSGICLCGHEAELAEKHVGNESSIPKAQPIVEHSQ
ncbi:Neuropeptide capa receptor [Orchesella cincta]|uniref:Neuropeptide capa receptor n=1 Tax=Orchesella cincta TaxID=48709 RepID=A0A1D2MW28_ORCCI|nr:Neuropeptide capa receptor [Orchesella cincta]